jgi:hypothetical protein
MIDRAHFDAFENLVQGYQTRFYSNRGWRALSDFVTRFESDTDFAARYIEYMADNNDDTAYSLREFFDNVKNERGPHDAMRALFELGIYRLKGNDFSALYVDLCARDSRKTFLVLNVLSCETVTRKNYELLSRKELQHMLVEILVEGKPSQPLNFGELKLRYRQFTEAYAAEPSDPISTLALEKPRTYQFN